MASAVPDPTRSVRKITFALRPVVAIDEEDGTDTTKRPIISFAQSEEVILGRCRLTQIRDVELSRQQVRILSNDSPDSVEITQLSKSLPSFINGQPLFFPWSKTVLVGDSICLRKGRHEYKLEVSEEVVTEKISEPTTKKRRAGDAFEVPTPASPLADNSRKKSRPSLQFTPIDLARQLNTFGSTGKIKTPGDS